MTADDIFYKLNTSGTHVGKTTIYRYLNMLEANGDIRKYVTDNIACYQYIKEKDSCKNHYHLRCSKCARLFHVESEELDNIEDIMMKKYNFKVDSSKLILYGCCEKCS
jgi:Fur family ferric uptake transcriptional regulator